MTDGTIHSDQPAFEDFVERELKALGDRAQEQGICVDCLTDRFIVEMVAIWQRNFLSLEQCLYGFVLRR